MGIEWYLVDTARHRFFDLSKGRWTQNVEVYFDKNRLLEYLCINFTWSSKYSLYLRDLILKFTSPANLEDIQVARDTGESFFNLTKDDKGNTPHMRGYDGPYRKWRSRFASESKISDYIRRAYQRTQSRDDPVQTDDPVELSILEDRRCADCGWPLVDLVSNESFRYWAERYVYCAHHECENHEGDGYEQVLPAWVHDDS